MKYITTVLVSAFVGMDVAHAADTIFTDDLGTGHTIVAGSTIVCGAMDAITMHHFGMEASQIEGTFGERSSSGSNYGGSYFNGNIADHGDHSSAEFKPENFPADPDEAERAFLSPLRDYSPSCSASNYYCSDIDIALLNKYGWPDYIVFGSFYSSLLTEDFRGNATDARVTIIELTTAYGSTPDEEVLPRGMVEITERWEDLASAFIGADVVAKKVASPKAELCAAAAEFSEAAKAAQDKGVRAMAGYLPYAGAGENGEIGAFLASPERDTVLAMLEELGMAILHNDAEPSRAYEYQVSADFSTGLMPYENIMSAGEKPVRYDVDFWLYDDRVTLDFLSDSFKEAWPHKAVVAKQYAYFPANSRVFSYQHAAEILSIVGESLKSAQQLSTDSPFKCTAVEGGVSGEEHRSNGLLPGQYACYNVTTYSFCNDQDESAAFGNIRPNAVTNGLALLGLAALL